MGDFSGMGLVLICLPTLGLGLTCLCTFGTAHSEQGGGANCGFDGHMDLGLGLLARHSHATGSSLHSSLCPECNKEGIEGFF